MSSKQQVEAEVKKAMSAEEAFHINQRDQVIAEIRACREVSEKALRSKGGSPVDAVYAASQLAGSVDGKVDPVKAIKEARRIGKEAEERLRAESGTKAPREILLTPAQIGGAVVVLTLLGAGAGAGIHTVVARRAATKAAAKAAADSGSGNLPLG